jgi:hypothetical protein
MSRPFPPRQSTGSRGSGEYIVAGRSLRERSVIPRPESLPPRRQPSLRAGLRSWGPASMGSPPIPSQSSSDFEAMKEDDAPRLRSTRGGGKSVTLVPASDPMGEEEAEGGAGGGEEGADGAFEDEVKTRSRANGDAAGDSEFDPNDEPEPDPADDKDYQEEANYGPRYQSHTSRSGRVVKRIIPSSDDDEEVVTRRTPRRSRTSRTMKDFVEDDEEDEEDEDPEGDYAGRGAARRQRSLRLKEMQEKKREEEQQRAIQKAPKPFKRTSRNSRKAAVDDDEAYEESEEEDHGTAYAFRKRGHISYKIPTVEDIMAESSKATSRPKKRAPFNMTGRQLGRLFGENVDDSSDDDFATPGKGKGVSLGAGLISGGAAGVMDFSAGTPSNLGRINGAASTRRSSFAYGSFLGLTHLCL